MREFSFEAIGTHWSIAVDADHVEPGIFNQIQAFVKMFEERFSRFREPSEATQFRQAIAGTYPISPDLRRMLMRANELRQYTGGAFDPAIGVLLERAGYDSRYRFIPLPGIEALSLPRWELQDERLTISGPIVIDLGGIGKGYCIDGVAGILFQAGLAHFLVEAGGDMFGTTKQDGRGWQIAIEWPGRPGIAAGTVELRDQGFAASDRFRRRWGEWHHIVDGTLKAPVQEVLGSVALAPTAFSADSMTSCLFLAPKDAWGEARTAWQTEYLVFQGDRTIHASGGWTGTFFQ